MSARPSSARKPAKAVGVAKGVGVAVDVVLFSPRGNDLAVLLVRSPAASARSRDRWTLPSDTARADETLDETAMRVARTTLGTAPSLLDQARATIGRRTVADKADVTVTYFGLAPDAGGTPRPNVAWALSDEVARLAARETGQISVAVSAMRASVDHQPIAFRLLPATFTLSELQAVYELLLGRRLHKASFRRALHASSLVEATDELRSEGRGRPAQLFRYAPPRRRRARRGIRFDLLT
jgi:8-oxo-dGTP diphosphatase